ncbi:IgGFc-binding protein [Nannocystis radixulma]|uniref:IgGFc-binding protein n=1 Tax=Nannocystis radixulma TaxID=2995305 RepID=A0ABT5AZ33_9BACT|nr:IgGFc-binding protein [Nannocystis radixulma]MDC0667093.1 IgGFc-binding protein [Nannocystis radixulma]
MVPLGCSAGAMGEVARPTRFHRFALLALPLAVACADDAATDPSATAASTTGPGLTTNSTAPTTGTTAGSGTSTTSTTDPTGASQTTATTDAPASTTEGVMSSTSAGTTDQPVCPAGTIVCDGDTAQVCDGMGGFESEELCPTACVPDVGCAECVPGDTRCQGNDVEKCDESGTAWNIVETCDGLQGLACDPQAGTCLGACAGLGLSHIGCDYYPTVLQQVDLKSVAPTYEYAVAVANTSDQAATVTVTRAGAPITQVMVAPMSVQLIVLPWIDALSQGKGPSVVVVDGAYRLRSTAPVVVYQYNAFKASGSNGASLLLPVNTWTGNYLVAAWPPFKVSQNFTYPGFYAVVASQDNTKVTLTPSTTGKLVQAGGGVAADGTGVVTLDADDVLQVMSAGDGDLTGTIVQADKPVQVFGGNECTNVPLGVDSCDHIEESMFPLETLAKEYVVVPPVQVPNDQLDKAQVVRVIASEDNTTLTFNPDQPVAKNLAEAGDFVELTTTTAKFVVTADKKILVSQYMVGEAAGYGTGDPAMLLAVTPQQWRKNHLFHALPNWTVNYVDVLAPKNASVTVDGVAVGGWQAVGATNYQVAHIKLNNDGTGNHTVVGDVGVGISVYGVQNASAYWYPGGLDLDVLPP